MAYGLLLVNEYRKAVQFQDKAIATRAGAIGSILNLVQAFTLQSYIHAGIEQVGHQVERQAERHYGVLMDILLHNCRQGEDDERIPQYGGVRVIGAGPNIQAAGRQYFDGISRNGTLSAPNDCHLYLWKDPFGISVVSLQMMGQPEPVRLQLYKDPNEPCYE